MRRVIAGLGTIAAAVALVGTPAHAATVHTVSVACAAGAGASPQAWVNALVGDTLVVNQTGCAYFQPVVGRSVPVGGGFTASARAGGFDTTPGTTIRLTILEPMTSGMSIVFFSPTSAIVPGTPDQAYIVKDTDDAAPPSLNYVALGDSYSSGEGAGAGNYFQTNGVDIACHRAPTAWSFKLAQTSPQISDDVQNAACSGAVTANMLSAWFKGEQPQVEYLRQRNAIKPVNLVTFTIGGNDAGFSGLVKDCYTSDCAVDAQTGKWRAKAREAARKTVHEIVPALRAAAPNATIVLVGYPRLLPIQARDTVNCGWLTNTERTALNALVRDLNKIFDDAIITERFANANFVAPLHIVPTNALDGHELCSRSPHVVKVYGNPKNSEQAHPDANGQADYAAAVLTGLKSFGVVTQ